MEFLIFFGVGLFLLGLGFLISFLRTRHDRQGEANWPSVLGKVDAASVYEHTRTTPVGATTSYTPLVTYHYEVGGQAYSSSKLNFLPDSAQSCSQKAEAQALVARLMSAETVRVFYNPRNPKQAVLRTHRPTAHRVVLWFGIAHLLMGGLVFALFFVLPS